MEFADQQQTEPETPKLDADQQRLVTDHLGLAERVAAKWQKRLYNAPCRDEFQSAAYLGLCDAARTYDAARTGKDNRKVKFKTHATSRVHGAIRDMLRMEMPKKFRRKEQRGDRITPRVVSLSAISNKHSGTWGEAEGYRVSSYGEQVQSQDEPVGAALEAIDAVHDLTRGLTRQDAAVVRDYYCTTRTLKEIGRKYGYSEQRISQIRLHAITELQRQMGRYT